MKGVALIFTQDAKETMHSRIPAAQQRLGGKTILAHVKELLGEIGVTVAESAGEISPQTDFVLLLAGNAPLLRAESCRRLIRETVGAQCGMAMLCVGTTSEIVAACVCTPRAKRVCIKERDTLETVITRLACLGEIRRLTVDEREGIRIRTCADIAKAGAALHKQINEALMDAGVLMIDPTRTYIDCNVRIGRGTVIYPGCILENGTVIGEGCTLYANCRLNHAIIGNDVAIESSVILDACVADHTTVGPYAYIRPNTDVGEGCRIGDFVEIKNSKIGKGTKVSHLTYVGDSDVGENVNLGCGVVFVNYDGEKKQRSVVGDRAFIGCNVNLVAPVNVGDDAYIAAGSTVTCDVPEGALLIAREREAIKEGWVAARKNKR